MNELTIPTNWEALKEQATMLVKSGFLPQSVRTPEQAIAIAITSKELGIGMMEGFRSINVIQGKPTISPQLMLALSNRTGQLENIKIDATDERCIVTVTRKGRDSHTEEFGVKEATGLGLMSRDNYRKQPATMFKWRALAANLRVTFPDVMLGFYTPEEMGAEVKVTESEEMEIVQPEGINTGVRVPKEYWDLKETDPEAAQARLGEDCYPWKVKDSDPKKSGWYIFSKSKADDFVKDLGQKTPPEPLQNAPESPQSDEKLISHEQQLEIVKLVKEKGIHHKTAQKYLKDKFGYDGTAKIKASDYLSVYEFFNSFEGAGVGE